MIYKVLAVIGAIVIIVVGVTMFRTCTGSNSKVTTDKDQTLVADSISITSTPTPPKEPISSSTPQVTDTSEPTDTVMPTDTVTPTAESYPAGRSFSFESFFSPFVIVLLNSSRFEFWVVTILLKNFHTNSVFVYITLITSLLSLYAEHRFSLPLAACVDQGIGPGITTDGYIDGPVGESGFFL